MKKFLAVLLAAVMLLSIAAFAEETEEAGEAVEVTDYEVIDLDEEDILDFQIMMDALPEGYRMETYPVSGSLYAAFICEGSPVSYLVSIAPDEMFDGYTLVIDDLDEAALNAALEKLSAADDFVNPQFSFTKTSHGTDVIIVNENDTSYDFVELISVYEGYVVTMAIFATEGAASDADIEIALQLLSDMWFVPAE